MSLLLAAYRRLVPVLLAAGFFVLVPVDNSADTRIPWDDHPIQDYAEFLFADLVVHATVEAFGVEYVPLEEIRKFVAPGHAGKYGRVSRVTLAVNEVLKGFEKSRHITFTMRAWINAPALESEGTEIIVGLQWNDELMRGTYELMSKEGLYVHDGRTFVSLGEVKGGREHSLREIQDKLRTIALEGVGGAATAVFIGTVVRMEDSQYKGERGEYGVIRKAVFRVDETVTGDLDDEVAIQYVAYGTYWPDWRFQMPSRIAAGQQFYVFVRQGDDFAYVPGGVNGMFRVQGDELLYNNHISMPIGKDELSARVRSYSRRKD